MISTDYTVKVLPETRNHKGHFLRHTLYKFIGIDASGWALICQDDMSCHYVDPACLKEVHRKESV